MVLILQIDAACSFHQVKELMLVVRFRLERFTGSDPSQNTQNVSEGIDDRQYPRGR